MDIPQAHRGRRFDRTGFFAFYAGGDGLTGPVLGPGSHFTGFYDELRLVECGVSTIREDLDTLTRDGVHFGFEVAVRMTPDCSDASVVSLLDTLAPDQGRTITTRRIYETFVQPVIAEVAREIVSPFRANELNERQAEVTAGIRKRILQYIQARERRIVVLHEVIVARLHLPQEMDAANLERATQAVLRDKAVAERERLQAEIETMNTREKLSEKEGETAAVKIDRIGAALARYPGYLQYDLQVKMPEIYREAGTRGNLIIAAPDPLALHPREARPAAPAVAPVPAAGGHGRPHQEPAPSR